MKPIVLGAASFVLALGLSTGGAVMRNKSAAAKPVPAAEAKGDSTHAGSKPDSAATPADSARPAPATADSTVVDSAARSSAVADSTRPDSTATALVPPLPAPAGPVIPPPVATVPRRTVDEPDYKLIAKIFANMKATDAAKVLGYMTDDEVQGVIQKLNVRQAAELMSKLPKERAANLSRRLVASTVKP